MEPGLIDPDGSKMREMIGLQTPTRGRVELLGAVLATADAATRRAAA